MKPFDLEKALAGEPVVTREGKEVSQLTLLKFKHKDSVLIGVIDDRLISCWETNGKSFHDISYIHDLFMATKETKKIKIAIGKNPLSNGCYLIVDANAINFGFDGVEENWIIKEVEMEV